MDRTYPCELTCICLINCNQKILVMKKNDSEFEPSLTFPGGHVEPNESVTSAAIREIKEETGLTIVSPTLMGFVNFDRQDSLKELIFVYQATIPTETATHNLSGTKNEGQTLWLARNQMKNYKLNSVVSAIFTDYLNHKNKELYFPSNQTFKEQNHD
ncbi:NUDIX domain-containing protein [Pediococcus parvulus]|uniref:NUDIX domain-containing protein n=1 Tax=Pediococcus parvulus TaxID=54062 RepID=UPI0021A41D45|nr:NUDIX domain-containing protein [Pediococcus parvulus]MCT3035405.1 NUDIX domain-containing protein [Pediococcus parvulus]